MSKPGTPGTPSTPSNTLLLRRQLAELTKHPVEGFSAGMCSYLFLGDVTLGRRRHERSVFVWSGTVLETSDLLLYAQDSSMMTTYLNGRSSSLGMRLFHLLSHSTQLLIRPLFDGDQTAHQIPCSAYTFFLPHLNPRSRSCFRLDGLLV